LRRGLACWAGRVLRDWGEVAYGAPGCGLTGPSSLTARGQSCDEAAKSNEEPPVWADGLPKACQRD